MFMRNILNNILLIIVSLSAGVGVIQAAASESSVKLVDIMQEGPGSAGLKMLPLQDDIAYAQRKFHELFENRMALINDGKLIHRINANYTPQFASALRGYLLMAARRYAEAFQALEEAGPAVSIEAQQQLDEAAWNDRLGFNATTGYAYLKKRERAGEQHAQESLIQAALCGKFGFDAAATFDDIVACASAGNQHAKKMLIQAALRCPLPRVQRSHKCGYYSMPFPSASSLAEEFEAEEVKRAYTMERAGDGDQNAQKSLIFDAEDNGDRVFSRYDASVRWFFQFYNAIRGYQKK